jgi:hypothetical protein
VYLQAKIGIATSSGDGFGLQISYWLKNGNWCTMLANALVAPIRVDVRRKVQTRLQHQPTQKSRSSLHPFSSFRGSSIEAGPSNYSTSLHLVIGRIQ